MSQATNDFLGGLFDNLPDDIKTTTDSLLDSLYNVIQGQKTSLVVTLVEKDMNFLKVLGSYFEKAFVVPQSWELMTHGAIIPYEKTTQWMVHQSLKDDTKTPPWLIPHTDGYFYIIDIKKAIDSGHYFPVVSEARSVTIFPIRLYTAATYVVGFFVIDSTLERHDKKWQLWDNLFRQLTKFLGLSFESFYRAHHDPVLKLDWRVYHRNFMYDYLKKKSGEDIGLAYIDLNNFKRSINAPFGHLAGDVVIEHVARVLDKTLQAIKQNNSRFVCVRYGGDEFVIVGTKVTEEEIRDLLIEFHNNLDKEHGQLMIELYRMGKMVEPRITFSAACLSIRGKGHSEPEKFPYEMIDAADRVLSMAKKRSRGEDPNAKPTKTPTSIPIKSVIQLGSDEKKFHLW